MSEQKKTKEEKITAAVFWGLLSLVSPPTLFLVLLGGMGRGYNEAQNNFIETNILICIWLWLLMTLAVLVPKGVILWRVRYLIMLAYMLALFAFSFAMPDS